MKTYCTFIFLVFLSTYTCLCADSLHLRTISVFQLPSVPHQILLSHDTAFIADDTSGIFIVDVNDVNNPTMIGFYKPYYQVIGLRKVDSILYVASGANGLKIVNIANVHSPFEVGHCDLPGFSHNLEIYGSMLSPKVHLPIFQTICWDITLWVECR
jgi:hypothetical protein